MDPELIKTVLPLVESLRLYHRHEVHGLGNIPRSGGALLVVNHSLATYDIVLLWAAIYREHERMVRGLVDRLFFKIPGLGNVVELFGATVGTPDNARKLLQEGEIICVAPGGMKEALRPSSEKYKIMWNERKGFAKLAIRAQVPVILGACPRADDLYEVYPNAITDLAYKYLKIPIFIARGVGLSPLPRPVKLVHYLSRPIVPPKFEGEEPSPELVQKFHARIVRRMRVLMAKAIISDEK